MIGFFLLNQTRRAVCACFAASGWVLLSGCASLDPARNVDRAATLVENRAGSETGWTAPWEEDPLVWDGASPLSADAAVRIALQNNREIRQRVESIAAVRADYVQAHLLPNPMISLALGFPIDGMGGQPIAAALMQQLAWLWLRPPMIDAAEHNLRAAVLEVSDRALRLVADVRSAHADVVFAERALALSRDNIELIERSAELVRARFDAGEASRLDLNRIQLELLDERNRAADRAGALDDAKRRVLELLSRADASVEWTSDDAPAIDLAIAESVSEDEAIALAKAQRLDAASARAMLEAAAARVELAKRGGAPDVAGGAMFERNHEDRETIFGQVQITPKIFDDNRVQVARAESEHRQVEIAADGMIQTAVAEARRAWVALRAQMEVVSLYEGEIVALAEENLSLARDAFEAGESDLTVLLEAQRMVNQARLELSDRRRDAMNYLIELERAAGGSLAMQPPVDELSWQTENGP